MKKVFQNNKGFGILETLVSLGILSIATFVVLQMMGTFGLGLSSERAKNGLLLKRQDIVATILSQSSWNKTIAANSPMLCRRTYPSSCSNETQASINLYDSDGDLYLNSAGDTYSFDGKKCSPTSSTVCPLKIKLEWKVFCETAEECKYPTDLVKLTFYKNPAFGAELPSPIEKYNLSWIPRRNLSDNSSPMISCAKTGKIFVGFGVDLGEDYASPQMADENGCVPLTTFVGEPGFPGVQGPVGPRGAVGPRGRAGIVRSSSGPGPGPSPSPSPSPSPTPLATTTVALNVNGDCVTVSCPAGYYIAGCSISFRGSRGRGCVSVAMNGRTAFLKEGRQCDAGNVTGTLTCSSTPPNVLMNSANCPINQPRQTYPGTGTGAGCPMP